MTIHFDRWVDSIHLELLESGEGDLRVDGFVNAKTVPYGMLALTTEGHYELSYDGETTVVPTGTAMFAPPMTPVEVVHRVDSATGRVAFRFVHLRFTLWGGVDVFALMRPPRLFTGTEAAEMTGLIDGLLHIGDAGTALERLARRQELAFGLLRCLTIGADFHPDAPDILDRQSRLLPVLRLLRERFADPWTVDEIAAMAQLSRASLHRQFMRLTGVSPIEYVRRLRLDDAAWRLLNMPDSVARISSAVGYANQFHFSREFSRRFGAPPSVYRQARVFGEVSDRT